MPRMTTPERDGNAVTRSRDAIVRLACRLSGCEHGQSDSDTDTDTGGAADSALLTIGTGPPGARDAAPVSGNAITVAGLSKVYSGGVVGAQDIDIEVRAGEIVSILGPNGAGKSTILNVIVGLLRPTTGSVTVHDVPSTDVRRTSRLVGVALQSTGLDPSMTAREHMRAQAALYEVSRRDADQRGAYLLETLGLSPYVDRQVVHFSVGLQRRLVLALALVHDPSVIVFDEPTAGLDPQSRRLMWDLLEQLRDEGRTVVFSTQILEEADVLASRVYVIDGGKVVAAGAPAELRRRYGEQVLRVRVAERIDAAAELLTTQLPELGVPRRDAGALVFDAGGGDAPLQKAADLLAVAGVEVLEISLGRPSLEEAFVQLTGRAVRSEPLVNSSMSGGALCRCQ